MAVKVIVIDEEEVSKLPQDLIVLLDEEFDSLADYHLKAVINDVKLNIAGMEMDDEVRFLTVERASEIAETVHDEYSYSAYNEFVTEKITEVADEIADSLEDDEGLDEDSDEFDMDKADGDADEDEDADEFDMDSDDDDDDDTEDEEDEEELVSEDSK